MVNRIGEVMDFKDTVCGREEGEDRRSTTQEKPSHS